MRAHISQVRIIGGEWRGRRLDFAALPGLRPTGDRVRETLFNWLAPELPGARCLDLFAGAGALGFEALSRGAAQLTLVEKAGEACRALIAGAERLGAAGRTRVVHADARRWLEGNDALFDILFLDPPFDTGLLEQTLDTALARLKVGGLAYVESPAMSVPAIREGFTMHRSKRFGDVNVELWRLVAGPPGPAGC